MSSVSGAPSLLGHFKTCRDEQSKLSRGWESEDHRRYKAVLAPQRLPSRRQKTRSPFRWRALTATVYSSDTRSPTADDPRSVRKMLFGVRVRREVVVNRLTRYVWGAGAGVVILALAFFTVLANAVTLVITLVVLAAVVFALSRLVVAGTNDGRHTR